MKGNFTDESIPHGVMAGAKRLDVGHKPMENLLRGSMKRLAEEMAVMAEIGRVISSKLDIEEVYESFALQARTLVPFDRLSVDLIDSDKGIFTVTYVSGFDIPGRRPGDSIPLAGTVSEEIFLTRKGLLIDAASCEDTTGRFSSLTNLATVRAGMRSLISAPLVSQNEVIGALHFRLQKSHAYTEGHLRLAERIGAQIAGAIANARLFAELKKKEKLLRESEGRFRAIVQQAAVGVAEVDLATGRYLAVNRRLCEITGLTETEILDCTFLSITHPEDRQAHEEGLKLLLAGTITHFTVEKRYLRRGEEVWVNLTISALWRPPESPKKIIVIVQDITERKRIEEELRKSRETEERLTQELGIISEIGRKISETLHIDEVYERLAFESGRLITYDRLVVTRINPQEEMYTIVYVSGMDIPERRAGASLPLVGSVNEAITKIQDGVIVQASDEDEVKRINPYKNTVYLGMLSRMSVPLIWNDEVIGALNFRSIKPNAYTGQDLRLARGIGREIAGAIANAQLFTELKNTEKSLRESEGRFRTLVEQAAVGVAEVEMETGCFIMANRRLCEMLGRTEEEMLASTFLTVTHPEDLHLHEERTTQMLVGKIGYYSLQKRYLRKDGEFIWANTTVSPLWRSEDLPRRNIIVVEDITERKRAEEELDKYQRQLEERVKERTIELEMKNIALQELNTALKVLLKQREDDKVNLEETFLLNIKSLVLPLFIRMKKRHLNDEERLHLEIIENNLNNLTSPLLKNLRQFNLTPREVTVASLVRAGKSTKDIADILRVATGSIDIHRKNIRKKMGLNKKKANLQSYLETFEQ